MSRLKNHWSSTRSPLDKDQRLVTTPYGRGLVVRSSRPDNTREIQLLDWTLANGRNPILYSCDNDFKSVPPKVGDDVLCLYGRGKVIAMDHEKVVVQLSSWRLAGRSLVTCHLHKDVVEVVRAKTLYEMDAYERVAYAQELKATASTLFEQKQYKEALTVYSQAVDAVRRVQHDDNSSNELRADLVVVMITCCNNAATCSAQLSRWTETSNFAKNALVLLDALYEKRGLRIHTIVNKEGLHDAKLFGEWKVKSLLLMARAMAEQGDASGAMHVLKQAHDVIAQYTQDDVVNNNDPALQKSIARLNSQDKQVKRLHATCVQRKNAERKKEKKRAMAMFGSPVKEKETQPVVTPSPTKKYISDKESIMKKATVKKRVSFSEDTKDAPDEQVPADEVPWYEEHKEALVLSAIVGLSALSVAVLRSRKK